MSTVSCSYLAEVTWSTSPRQPILSGDVHVWRLFISGNLQAIENGAHLLSEAERDRAQRFLQQHDRQRSLLSRILLRCVLARYTGEHPREILFTAGRNKKPGINVEKGIEYNISHSGDCILVAVAGQPVGVDVEACSARFDFKPILSTCFSERERDYIMDHGRASFYRCWTRKEALVKAVGKGIDDDIMHVPCLDGSHILPQSIRPCNDWNVVSFEATAGYTGSVACIAAMQSIRFYTADLNTDPPNL